MTYKDERGYQREHSNAIHRHRAYYHIYLKDRKKYPLPFEAYEVHHIDWNKNNNRMNNLAVLTPDEHDNEHETMEKFGMDLFSFAKLSVRIMERFSLKIEDIFRLFLDRWDKFISGVKSPSKEFDVIYNFKKFGGKYYPPYSELKERVWRELIKDLEKKKITEDKEKKRNGKFNLAKKWVLSKVKKEKVIEPISQEKSKQYNCQKCGREINHKGNCLPCNAKAKREREGERSKIKSKHHKRNRRQR